MALGVEYLLKQQAFGEQSLRLEKQLAAV